MFGSIPIQLVLSTSISNARKYICVKRIMYFLPLGWLKKLVKMNWFETYLACIKGYVGAGILFLPKSFANGGMVWSALVMCFSGWVTTICALKLIRIGQKMNCYCYS